MSEPPYNHAACRLAQFQKITVTLCLAFAVLLLPACNAGRRGPIIEPYVRAGDYGKARILTKQYLITDRSDRDYLLQRMQLGILTLADGYPESSQLLFEDMYEILRTQGINADKTVASVVINEGVKFWKGEPFEQALTFFYYGVQQGMLGQWDNTRAAAASSLFQLRDFSEGKGTDSGGERINTEEIARRALEYERQQSGKPLPPGEKDYLNSGYAVQESNFTLGYLMHGIASQQLGRTQEANDFFAVAANLDRNVRPLVDELKSNRYNTILVVSHGLGPAKVAYGTDGALSRFEPRFPSDGAALRVSAVGGGSREFPLVCDVNQMAADHRWNNLEDVRRAKSVIGSGLVGAGAIVTGVGADRRSAEAAAVGIGMIIAGAAIKAGSVADTRQCHVMPQRVYIVPLLITGPNSKIELQVGGKSQSRMVLAGLKPPLDGDPAQLRYVRLNAGVPTSRGQGGTNWATSGAILYANDRTGLIGFDGDVSTLKPFVLGGRDVRTPSPDVIKSYAHDPQLRHMTVNELGNLYRDKGILLELGEQNGYVDQHVLEGGKSMVMPLEGTAGFTRLVGQLHQQQQRITAESGR